LNARIQGFWCAGSRHALGQHELHQESTGRGCLSHGRGHLQLHRRRGLRHRCRHRELPLALVLAEDVARQDGEGLVAGLSGRAGHDDLGYRVGGVLAQLDIRQFAHDLVGGFFGGVTGHGKGGQYKCREQDSARGHS